MKKSTVRNLALLGAGVAAWFFIKRRKAGALAGFKISGKDFNWDAINAALQGRYRGPTVAPNTQKIPGDLNIARAVPYKAPTRHELDKFYSYDEFEYEADIGDGFFLAYKPR